MLTQEQLHVFRQLERKVSRSQVNLETDLRPEHRKQLRGQIDSQPGLVWWLLSSDSAAETLKTFVQSQIRNPDPFRGETTGEAHEVRSFCICLLLRLRTMDLITIVPRT